MNSIAAMYLIFLVGPSWHSIRCRKCEVLMVFKMAQLIFLPGLRDHIYDLIEIGLIEESKQDLTGMISH